MKIKDLLELLDEIKSIQEELKLKKSFLDVIILRLALHQLDNGPLKRIDDHPHWDKIVSMIQKNKLLITSNCEIRLSTTTMGCGPLLDKTTLV